MHRYEGFETFCERAWSPLVGALAQHTGDRWLAEELAQEALVRAGDRWDRIGAYDSPMGWCFRVGANLATSRFRRWRLEQRAQQRLDRAAPADEIEATVGNAAVTDALALLTDRQRQAVVLRHLLGLDVAAAAQVMEITDDALRALTHRGLAALRKQLGPDLLPNGNTTEEPADA